MAYYKTCANCGREFQIFPDTYEELSDLEELKYCREECFEDAEGDDW